MFARKLKQAFSGSHGVTGRANRIPYYLNGVLAFLIPHIKRFAIYYDTPTDAHETLGQDNDDEIIVPGVSIQRLSEDDTEPEEVCEPVVSEQMKKRKTVSTESDQKFVETNIQQNSNESEDYRKMFLISLLPELYLMNEHQIRQFKRKVLQAIDEILGSRTESLKYTSSNQT